MTVYRGILNHLGAGEVGDTQVRRSMIDVGGVHIRDVAVPAYYDALLERAIGEPVALSIARTRWFEPGRNGDVLVALKLGNGSVHRPSLFKALAGSVVLAFVYWFLAAVVAGLVLLVGGGAYTLASMNGHGWVVAGWLLALYLFALPWWSCAKSIWHATRV